MNYLRAVDQSGVPIKISYNNQPLYKSAIGGALTIVVYSLSFMYAIYVLIQWVNGGLLPTVQSESKTLSSASFKMNEGYISIGLFNLTGVNPFLQNNNIILPLLIIADKDGQQEITPLFANSQGIVQVSQLTLKIYDKNTIDTSQLSEDSYMLVLTRCDPLVIGDKGSCASDEIISDYFTTQLPFLVQLSIILESYNSKTQTNDKIIKSSYFVLEEQLTLYSQLLFKTLKQSVSRNILFDDYFESLHVSNYELNTMRITPTRKIIDFDCIAMFFLRLDNIQTTEIIQYPKLGTVLAQIGSIASLLMFLQQITYYINQQQLEQNILYELIEFYYPQFKEINIYRTIVGKIRRVTLKGRELNLTQFMKFYVQIIDILRPKLNLINQLYEVSRIELFLLHQFDKDKLENMKQYQQKLPVDFIEEFVKADQLSVHPLQFHAQDLQKAEDDIISIQNCQSTYRELSNRDFMIFSK